MTTQPDAAMFGKHAASVEINARLSELSDRARGRIPASAPSSASFAEIHWMSDEEVAERHALIAGLPSSGAEAESARRRIRARYIVNFDA